MSRLSISPNADYLGLPASPGESRHSLGFFLSLAAERQGHELYIWEKRKSAERYRIRHILGCLRPQLIRLGPAGLKEQ